MRMIIVWCLLVMFFPLEASARLLAEDLSEDPFLVDLPEIKSRRYLEDCARSRFPDHERKLCLSPCPGRSPLDIVYARAQARWYAVQPNDTLKKIARLHGATIEHIKRLNRMKGDRLMAGQRLLVPDKVLTVEINKSLNRLYLKAGDALIKEYPVSTGRSAEQTPVGIFFIQTRYPFPTWFHKGVVVSPASPDNYLGSRWLGFDKPQFGIHGTIFPEQIGRSVSKGCVRMKNEDVEELYEVIPVGTMVIITEI